MYFLIYSSYAFSEFDNDSLKVLLVKSRSKNKTKGITGMLLFLNGKFIQLLEGEEKAVKFLFNEICQDNRHKSVVLLKDGTATERMFEDWAMAFNTLSPEALMDVKGYEKLNSSSALQIFKNLSSEV